MKSILLGIILLFSSVPHSEAQTLAGFAVKDITPTQGSLAGYGYGARRLNPLQHLPSSFALFQKSIGTFSPIRVKVSYFQKNTSQLAWVSVDTVGIDAQMVSEVMKRMKASGFDRNNLFLSATHTHSGPGNLSHNLFWEVAAMDWFHKAYYEFVLDSITSSIQEAKQTAEEVSLYSLNVNTQGLQLNRRKAGDWVDPEARLILAKAKNGDHWLGAIINYAIHGTALGPTNFYFSSDVPGGIEHALEAALRLKAAVFINGIEGDVSPIENELKGIDFISKEFTNQILASISQVKPIEFKITAIQRQVKLPSPILDIKKCTTFKRFDQANQNLGPFYGSANLEKLPLSLWVSNQAPISYLQLGDLNIFTWPGEPTGSVGKKLKQIAEAHSLKNIWIFSLTNDYHAYFTDEEEFDRLTYESCFSLHGKQGAESVLKAYDDLLSSSQH